jgi:hypothetical protein
MGMRVRKIVSGAAGIAVLAGTMGVAGGLGLGLAGSGIAAAAGPVVKATYTCHSPEGTTLTVPTTIQDLNTAPSTLPEGTTYAVKPQLIATLPGSLLALAAAGHLTKLTVKTATLGLAATNFSGPSKVAASNTPIVVPVNTTTVAHGYTADVTYPASSYTLTATPGAKGTLKPAKLTLGVTLTGTVIRIPCGAPGQTYTAGKTQFVGTSTLAPIVTVGAASPVHPLTRQWEVASDGGIFAFANAKFFGSMGGKPLNEPVVGMAATPTGGGYWEVASDGGIFAFGNAQFYGSMGGKPLNKPIVGIAATPTGGGYWEVASDGGLFAFGNAQFYGSMGGKPLNEPIVGIASTTTGTGYWEVASDGGLFAFGTAQFYGSMGGKPLNKPIVGIASTVTGTGYWEVASDGGLFSFGTAAFRGSMGGLPLNKPIVGMAATPTGGGYWEVASDGGIFAFGTARFYGSMGGQPLNAPIVGMAVT